jgi:transglycosylase-like protein with SLT domain/sporulation related protein
LAGKAATRAKRRTIALAALALLMSGRAAMADAGPETDNALATLCGIVEASAKAEGLPLDFFTKLIWRESAFRPTAISPAGAQGVAQFMPQTASERGLADPFDPASAIPASAKFLGDLERRFGNLGLAAAAYNAGETAVANWLAGKGQLPFETQDYVAAITGHAVDEWRAAAAPAAAPPISALPASASPAGTPPASTLPEPARSCLNLIASLRTTPAASPVVSGWFAPWGVQIAASFSRASAMRAFVRVQHDFYSVVGGKNPFVLGSVVRSRGFRPFYRVRIGAQSRREAEKICTSLEAAGGACVVLRS